MWWWNCCLDTLLCQVSVEDTPSCGCSLEAGAEDRPGLVISISKWTMPSSNALNKSTNIFTCTTWWLLCCIRLLLILNVKSPAYSTENLRFAFGKPVNIFWIFMRTTPGILCRGHAIFQYSAGLWNARFQQLPWGPMSKKSGELAWKAWGSLPSPYANSRLKRSHCNGIKCIHGFPPVPRRCSSWILRLLLREHSPLPQWQAMYGPGPFCTLTLQDWSASFKYNIITDK